MAYAVGVTDAGVVVPRMADFLEEIRARYKAQTGLDVDWASDLVLGPLSDIMAQLLGELAEALQGVVDSHDLNNATGVQLRNLTALVGVVAKPATKGEVVLTCVGTPGTILTMGRLAEGGGSDGRARWVLQTDTTIPAGGSVDATFQAEQPGRIEAEPGQVAKIVTPVPGWTSVTNAAAASPGRDAEKDPELRVRRQQSLQVGQGLGIGALRSKVFELEYVDSCAVIDNPDPEERVIEGVLLPPNSQLVIVSPSTLTTDQRNEILRLIYKNTPGGTRIAGTDVVGTVTGADGTQKDAAFDFADELTANVIVALTMASGYSVADASPALRALVEDHIAGLLNGGALRHLQIAALAATVPGVLGIVSLINGSSADLEPTARQRVVLGTWIP